MVKNKNVPKVNQRRQNLKIFFDLIVLAKNSGHYSEREIHFFYDIWDATRLKQLEEKYKGNK